MSRKKLNTADPTANAAMGSVGKSSSVALELQKRARLREKADAERNARLSQRHEQQPTPRAS